MSDDPKTYDYDRPIERRVADALIRAGLIEHGPRRYNRPGAPIASAAPITWGRPVVEALLAEGVDLTIVKESHGRPFYYECTVTGCSLDGHKSLADL